MYTAQKSIRKRGILWSLTLMLSCTLALLSLTAESASQPSLEASASAERCFFEVESPFVGLLSSTAAWADYDGDQDMDVLIAGSDGNDGPVTRLYRNDGGSFVEIDKGFANLGATSATWADFDGDGDPDLLLTGRDSNFDSQSKLYRNDSGTFVEIETPFVGVRDGAAAWADYDQDSDLDVVITGTANGGSRASVLYRNDNGTFVDSGVNLIGVNASSVAWADYDKDGDPDLLLMGQYDYGLGQGYDSARTTRLYRNDNGVFADSEMGLVGLENGSAAWGDYDQDGDMDLAVMGISLRTYSPTTQQITYRPGTVIYSNDNGTLTANSSDVTALGDGDVSWSDYDRDGDLDFFIMGTRGGIDTSDTFAPVSILYQNNGGSPGEFSARTGAGYSFVNVRSGSATWADYNNDGYPDLLLIGSSNGGALTAQLYRNGPCESSSNVINVADGDVDGLIAAIRAANQTGTADSLRRPSASAVINLATKGSYTLTVPENSFAGGNGLPVITGTVVISGNGSTIARSSAPGTPDFRILANSGTLTLDSVIVSNGFLQESISPDQIGGAILNTGVLSITNSTVQSSTNRYGGGVGNRGGTVYIGDTLIENNGPVGSNGGGVFNSNEGRMTIERSVIRNNQASNDGGGVANQQEGILILRDMLVTSNRALSGDGGGVYNRSVAPSVVISSTISQNSADSTNSTGGGIANHASDRDSALTIQYSHILTNTSGSIGGGIASLVNSDFKADLVVSHSEITGNRAVGSPDLPGTGLGGGVANLNFLGAGNSTGLMTITHSTIRHNEAVNGGGVGNAVTGATGPVTIKTAVDSSAIYSNTATGTGDQRGNGGGIANVDATLDMINSTLSNNLAVSDGTSQSSGLGGGIFNASPEESARLTFLNSTLAENQAVAGGGLTNVKLNANASAIATFQNSIVANNTDLSGLGPNCLNSNLGAGAATLTSQGFNLDSGTTCGFTESSDLSNTDPLLGPLTDNGGTTWTHALLTNSPAIDAANSDACPATDQRDVARPVGNGCDIGAYEGGTRTAENRIYLPMTQR